VHQTIERACLCSHNPSAFDAEVEGKKALGCDEILQIDAHNCIFKLVEVL
jgi:hypothetical protein